MTGMEPETAKELGPLEPVVFALPRERGDAVVAALGRAALACVQPLASELFCLGHQDNCDSDRDFPGLERRRWPPPPEGVALGWILADLDLVLGRPDLVREVPKGWPWMVVANELHDDGHAFAGRDVLAGRAGLVLLCSDPTGPVAVRCGKGFQTNPTVGAGVFLDWLLNPAAFELTAGLARGRLTWASCSAPGSEPPTSRLSQRRASSRLECSNRTFVSKVAKRTRLPFETLLIVQPVSAEVEVDASARAEQLLEVPGREPVRTECRLLPGPGILGEPPHGDFQPDCVERLLMIWGGEAVVTAD